MDGAIDEAGDVAQQAIQEIAKADSNWAAIILLIVVLCIAAIVAIAVWYAMQGRVKRLAMRAEVERADSEERRKQMQLDHERSMQFVTAMNDRYDETLKNINTTLGGVAESWRQSNLIHEGTRKALERNSDLLERFAPPPAMPKRSSVRRKETSNASGR